MTQPVDKLNSFVSAMMTEAQAEADAIVREAQAAEEKALSAYEASLAAKYAEKNAANAAAAAAAQAKRLASAKLKCRRELLEFREKCADQVFASVRARLAEYTASPLYGRRLAELARSGAASIPGSGALAVYLRADDMKYASAVAEAVGAAEADVRPGSFLLGGVILARPDAHRRADLSYDSALEDLYGRFSDITGFDVEDRHGN